ncbi:MAG: hypothetical protein PHE35_06870 [Bacteroidales bacterium]|jgi:hypothetical protein|nr:hypothetical protein [Synergistaceae bacterium]MDD2330524.1 hypothetical protein [Bacteroidales bacterium]
MTLLIYNALMLFLIYLQSCTNERSNEYKYIESQIKDIYGIQLDRNIKEIYLVNDIGCGNCVITFSNYILDNVVTKRNNDKLILINSMGVNVNTEKFRTYSDKNIIINKNIRDTDDLLPDLGVIILNQNCVDTIITITASEIVNQLNYIDSYQ